MKPVPFVYRAPESLDEAFALLGEFGGDAKVLAGGQSLLPLMKLRLARPAALVDLNRVPGLSRLEAQDGHLAIGAMVRSSVLADSPLVCERLPIAATAASQIGHAAIRHRGTVGGSIAHADPAAEIPLLAVLLGAEVILARAGSRRAVAADDFFLTYLLTAAEPDEVLVEVRLPALPAGAGWSFMEFSRRQGDFALAAIGATLQLAGDGTIGEARIAMAGVGDRPLRARPAEQSLRGERPTPDAFLDAAALATADLEPPEDVHGTAHYRRQVARALVERALAEAFGRASGATQ